MEFTCDPRPLPFLEQGPAKLSASTFETCDSERHGAPCAEVSGSQPSLQGWSQGPPLLHQEDPAGVLWILGLEPLPGSLSLLGAYRLCHDLETSKWIKLKRSPFLRIQGPIMHSWGRRSLHGVQFLHTLQQTAVVDSLPNSMAT